MPAEHRALVGGRRGRQRSAASPLLPDIPAGTPLPSLDAIPIQAALDTEVTVFLTFGLRQVSAAQALGLRTEVLT